MPTWVNQPTEVEQISEIYCGLGQEGGGFKMHLGGVLIYADEKLTLAKAIIDTLEDNLTHSPLSLWGKIGENQNQDRPEDPGAEAVPVTFKFLFQKSDNTGPKIRASIYVAAFLADSRSAVQEMGESLAALIQVQSTGYNVRFTGTSRTR